MLDQVVRIKSVWDRPENIPGKALYSLALEHIKQLIDIAWEQEKRIQALENEQYTRLINQGGTDCGPIKTSRRNR